MLTHTRPWGSTSDKAESRNRVAVMGPLGPTLAGVPSGEGLGRLRSLPTGNREEQK